MYDKEWPVRQPSPVVRRAWRWTGPSTWRLAQKLDPDPTVEEVLRNFPVRQPLLWV